MSFSLFAAESISFTLNFPIVSSNLSIPPPSYFENYDIFDFEDEICEVFGDTMLEEIDDNIFEDNINN